MLRGEFFGFELALLTAGADFHDLGPHASRSIKLDRRSISGHDDDGLGLQRARTVGHALCMVAAGIRDHAALALLGGEGCDLVVSSAQLECADRLYVF